MAIAIPHPLLRKNANTAQRFLSRGSGFHAAILILSLSTLLGCGVPGAPLPPSADIPAFVGDLKAVRKGDTVTLTWTTPTETSDGELIRKPGKMLVQRALRSEQSSELAFQTISELPLHPTLKEDRSEQATATDTLTDLLRPGGAGFAVYMILAQGHNGKSFGLPNRVSVPLVPNLAPPQKISANSCAQRNHACVGAIRGCPNNCKHANAICVQDFAASARRERTCASSAIECRQSRKKFC